LAGRVVVKKISKKPPGFFSKTQLKKNNKTHQKDTPLFLRNICKEVKNEISRTLVHLA